MHTDTPEPYVQGCPLMLTHRESNAEEEHTHTHLTIHFPMPVGKKTRNSEPPAVNYTFILFVFSSVC